MLTGMRLMAVKKQSPRIVNNTPTLIVNAVDLGQPRVEGVKRQPQFDTSWRCSPNPSTPNLTTFPGRRNNGGL